MNTNHTYSIDLQALKVGVHSFTFTIDDHFFEAWPESEVHRGSGVVNVELARHLALIEMKINIAATVEISCDRCLDEFMLPVNFEASPVVRITDTPGSDDGDTIWVSPMDDRLELAQYIYESIILSLPFQRVHPDIQDCNQEMVRRFRIVSPEEIEQIEARAQKAGADEEQKNPFAALADLKEKL